MRSLQHLFEECEAPQNFFFGSEGLVVFFAIEGDGDRVQVLSFGVFG